MKQEKLEELWKLEKFEKLSSTLEKPEKLEKLLSGYCLNQSNQFRVVDKKAVIKSCKGHCLRTLGTDCAAARAHISIPSGQFDLASCWFASVMRPYRMWPHPDRCDTLRRGPAAAGVFLRKTTILRLLTGDSLSTDEKVDGRKLSLTIWQSRNTYR